MNSIRSTQQSVSLNVLNCNLRLQFFIYIAETNGRRDFDSSERTIVIPPGGNTIDQNVLIPIIDDRINEANEGFLLIVRANEAGNNLLDLANLEYMDEGVTLLRITDDDSKTTLFYIFHS